MTSIDQQALEYHRAEPHGKIEIVPTKPCLTQHDLSLAYSPGVAEPCRQIQANPETAYEYTAKGNLVAVITNGTAVLGLGNIGALAGKPVMEGKSILFKRFADVDSIDLEVNTENVEEFIQVVKLLEPTFGGVNLEDIKAPECFEIEQRLREMMDIPVFHDDQHGTAIISGAALTNALLLLDKKIGDLRIVFGGAGAAAVATARFYISLGAKKENIIFCDRTGVIRADRADTLTATKREFATKENLHTIEDALKGADVFVGLSSANTVNVEMIKTMAPKPIIFAMANPDPEIDYYEARTARPDALVATGRSDFPNQVNNVLGFPFIFRGTLDTRARTINEEMKIAAAKAIAQLAHEPVPQAVLDAYGLDELSFGADYLIPKPLDHRVLLWAAPAVAQASMQSGVARRSIDLSTYPQQLTERMARADERTAMQLQNVPC